MLPHMPRFLEFIYFKDHKDLPHLGLVILLIAGIIIGVYLSLQPAIFTNKAAEGSLVEVKFEPETLRVRTNQIYEAKLNINPKAERVTAVQLDINYDPSAVVILEAKNEGFLPITLKTKDSFDGTLTLIYSGTVDTQATSPGVVVTVKFKFIGSEPSSLSIKPGSQVSVSSREGNVLTEFPEVKLETGNGQIPQAGDEKVKYPDSLLLEKPVFPESSPFIEDFKEALEPKPSLSPERVKPELSERYILQLGRDIFVEPIVALNQVIEDKAGEILKPE